MVRISGVEIPAGKRIEVSLTYIYGVGKKRVFEILKRADIDSNRKANDLSDQEVASLQKAIDTIPTEGALRKIVSDNIKRLKQINSYRGLRHNSRLPVRGQRTRSNARTRRGKRMTIGAMKKEMLTKIEKVQKEKGKTGS